MEATDQNPTYHAASRPWIAGRFMAIGAVRKCSSISWNPASSSANCCGPIASIVESPIAESIEYRPPTQSQNPNMFSASIPNASTRSSLVETATKCFATASPLPSASTSQLLAEVALVSVSSVPKVFEQTTKSV